MKRYMEARQRVERDRAGIGEAVYDFYRCQQCGGLITRLEELEFLTPGDPREGRPCLRCPSLRYQPTSPLWYEFLRPKVIWFAALRLLRMA